MQLRVWWAKTLQKCNWNSLSFVSSVSVRSETGWERNVRGFGESARAWRFYRSPLHAALSLAQHHSAWWPESAWLTSSSYFRNPGNSNLSGAEFCSLRAPVFVRLWRAKRWQTAFTPIAPNTYAGHKRQQKGTTTPKMDVMMPPQSKHDRINFLISYDDAS